MRIDLVPCSPVLVFGSPGQHISVKRVSRTIKMLGQKEKEETTDNFSHNNQDKHCNHTCSHCEPQMPFTRLALSHSIHACSLLASRSRTKVGLVVLMIWSFRGRRSETTSNEPPVTFPINPRTALLGTHEGPIGAHEASRRPPRHTCSIYGRSTGLTSMRTPYPKAETVQAALPVLRTSASQRRSNPGRDVTTSSFTPSRIQHRIAQETAVVESERAWRLAIPGTIG